MKKDLRSMAAAAGASPASAADPAQLDAVKKQAQKYEGKSEAELMDALMKQVQQQKADGSFSPEQLDAFAARASAMLDDAQKKKLRQILSRIRS